MTRLRTARLTLRPVALDDVDALLALDPTATRSRLSQELLLADALGGDVLWLAERRGLAVARLALHPRPDRDEREIGCSSARCTGATASPPRRPPRCGTTRSRLASSASSRGFHPDNAPSIAVARHLGMAVAGEEEGLTLWTVDRP